MIDPSSDSADLAPGTRLDLPLWMVPPMAGRNMLQVCTIAHQPAVLLPGW